LCEQALTNLILNACEAMGDQGGELWIRIHRALENDDESDRVVAEIEDSGPGVAPELREQIFNPFFTTKKTGVGLGLAIVSKIVDAHGGVLTLTSQPGHGACFRLVLPAAAERVAKSA
jgi:two-component system, NtrC family, sensor histidine kinase HydH